MLKYFGLKEILFGLKRFVVLVVAFTIIFGVLGYIAGGTSETVAGSSEMYYSSCSYLVTATLKESEQSQSESDRAVANTVSAMLTTDFSKQFVLEKLLEAYSIEQILEYTGAQASKENADYTIFNDSIVSSVLVDTAIVNFYVKSSDEEFSKIAVSYFERYLNDVISKKVSQLDTLENLGGTTVNERNFNNESKPLPKKNAAIFAIVGFVLSVCGVLVFVLFKPSVAAKKDYEEYGVVVLDDCAEHKRSDFAYTADMVMNNISKNDYSSIAVISTINNRAFMAKFEAVALKLQNIGEDKCSFAKANGIITDFAQFETVKGSDSVILVEQKGKTYHSDLANTLSLLAKYDIPVLGVILI